MRKAGTPPSRPARKLLVVLVSAAFASSEVLANPVGPSVAAGSASFSQVGRTLSVTNSPGAIINWRSFSIAGDEVTRFIQQSVQSSVLNRVVGVDPSAILGTLASNGRVFLINPSGIIFGPGSRVDVAGLVASTLNITDQDFLAGRLNFQAGAVAGALVNQGTITTPAGGQVLLIAPDVRNHGIVSTPGGETILAAGKSVKLVESDLPELRVEVQAGGEALNVGQILTDGGKAGIYAALIANRGLVRADTVSVGERGQIILKASRNITLEAGSVISASGAPGGAHDGGSVRIVADDTLDMQRGSAVRVDGGVDGGDGGFLELSGRQRIALNGEFTGRAWKEGYKHGSLLLDPLNIAIGANGLVQTIALTALSFTGVGKAVITPDGSRVYIARPEFFADFQMLVDVVDIASGVVASIVIPNSGSQAIADMVLSPDGNRLYAVTFNSGVSGEIVSVIDTNPASPTFNTVINTFGAGLGARGIAVSPDGNRLFVPHILNPPAPPVVSVIDAFSGAELAAITVSGNPGAVVANPNPAANRVYVVNSGQLQEIDTGTNTLLGTTSLGGRPTQLVAGTDGTRLYLAYADRIEVRDSATKAVLSTVPIGADAMTVNAAGTRAYVTGAGTATVVDLTTNSGIQSFPTGGTGNTGVVFNAGLNRFYATASPTNTLNVFDLNVGSDSTTGGVIAHTDSPGATLSLPVSALNGAWTNVSLAATNNVSVNSPIATTDVPAGGSLTLTAGNDVNVYAAIGSPGARFAHDLTLTAGRDVNVNAPIYQASNLVLAADAGIPAQGIVSDGVGNVNIRALGMPVVVDTLGNLTATGQNMNVVGGRNAAVSVIVGGLFDANVAGNFTLQGGLAQIDGGGNANASASVQANAVSIVAGGAITIAGGDNASAIAEPNVAGDPTNSTVTTGATLASTTSIDMSGSSITIRGGDGGYASAHDAGAIGAWNATATVNANATVSAGGAITLNGTTVTIRGGDSAEGSACCFNGSATATQDTNATVSAGSSLTVNATSLTVRGGDFAFVYEEMDGFGNGADTVNASVTVSAGTTMTLAATSDLTIRGGDSAGAFQCCNGLDGPGPASGAGTVNVNATVSAVGAITLDAPTVVIRGGDFNSGGACCNGISGSGAGAVTLNANVAVSAGGDVAINSGSLTVRGGDDARASACCQGSNLGAGTGTATINARATLSAGQDLTLNVPGGAIFIRGGDGASASGGCCNGMNSGQGTGTVSVDVSTTVTGNGLVTVTAGSLEVRGGDGAVATDGCCNGNSGGMGNVTATTIASASLTTPQNMVIDVTGPITIRGGNSGDATGAGNGENGGVATTMMTVNADATVSAGGSVTLTAGSVDVAGGGNGGAAACCNAASGSATVTSVYDANAALAAGTTLAITAGSVTIRGGDNTEASACCNAGSGMATVNATANANAMVSAGTSLTVNASSLTVSGGRGASASMCCGPTVGTVTGAMVANANATLSAGQAMTLTVTGPLSVTGGSDARGSASRATSGTANATANALISAGTSLTLTATALTVRGGDVGSAAADGAGNNTAMATANASILAGTMNLTVAGAASIRGGTEMYASADGVAGAVDSATVNSNALVRATGDLTLSVSGGSVTVAGGSSSSARVQGPGGVNRATVNSDAELSAGGNLMLTVTGGSLTVRGGRNTRADAALSLAATGFDAAAVFNARGKIAAGGNATIDVSGAANVQGGDNNGVSAFSGDDPAAIAAATVNADGSIESGSMLSVSVGSLTVRGGDGNSASVFDSGRHTATLNAPGKLLSGGAMSLTSTGALSVRGGNNADAFAGSAVGAPNMASVDASGLINPTGLLTINAGSLTVQGGAQALGFDAVATGGGSNFASTLANASLVTATGDFTYTGGPLSLLGGTARTQGGAGTNSATSEASALVQIGGAKTLDVTGNLVINGGMALDDPLFPNLGGAIARAILDPGTLGAMVSGDVSVTGGAVTGIGSAYASMSATGPINLSIGGSTGLTLEGSATGLVADPASPITVTYTGGGSEVPIVNPSLDTATILTTLFVLPPPPPPPPPPPSGAGEATGTVFDPNVLAPVIQGAKMASAPGEVTIDAGDGGGAPDEEKKRAVPRCN
jgi:filamentous hemagglutinin family protein